MPFSKTPFTKMQSLRNDFVLIEEKNLKSPLSLPCIRLIADRHQGIGCDQVIVIKDSEKADADLSFYNADGSEASACGNGTRCVAKYLEKDAGFIQTPSFLSTFQKKGDDITISMKEPSFFPSSPEGHRIDVGNPHLVIFTADLQSIPLATYAPSFQPSEGINIEIAQVISPTTVKVNVWERGVGITSACGSGACAVGILSLKLGLIQKSPVFIEMEGGLLEVDWIVGLPPLLTGPAHYCFEGTIDLP